MTYQALSFAAKSYFRRLHFHWPMWLSTIGAVALVGIGSALPNTFQDTHAMRGFDAAKAALILKGCAVVVAAIQVSIMSLRALLADAGYFHTLFSMGATPIEIALIRAVEMFIGCVFAVFAGMCVAVVSLNYAFGVSVTSVTASALTWVIFVGMLPAAFIVFVLQLATAPR